MPVFDLATNITPGGRRLRMTVGVIGLLVGLAAYAGLIASGSPRAWRALLFLPFWLGALGVLQARAKT